MTGPYGLLSRAEGMAECELTGAEPAVFLNRCAGAGIPLAAVSGEEGGLRLSLPLRELKRAENLALRSQCELKPVRRRGGALLLRRMRLRLTLLICLALNVCVLLGSRLFLWEMTVSGNENVSSARILNALADCGVGPGSFWPAFNGEALRSELLEKLPELSWAAVNVHGSRAEVIVRERIPKPPIYDARIPTDLVALRPGFVREVRALNGTALVKPGSAVAPGETLIAGRAESAFSGGRALHAAGSVSAETYRELSAVTPASEALRQETGKTFTRWALEIGTKRINFYRNSSICGENCVKIRSVWQCRAKRLFTLPVALVRERYAEYGLSSVPRDAKPACESMERQLREALTDSLSPDASVEQTRISRTADGARITVCLRAVCTENIAVEQILRQEEDLP